MVEDWSEARCRGIGDTFYTSEVDARLEQNREIRENYCRAICFTCPLRIDCLETAVMEGETMGVWGGMSESERRRFVELLVNTPWAKKQNRASFRRAVRMFYEQEREQYITVGYRQAQ